MPTLPGCGRRLCYRLVTRRQWDVYILAASAEIGRAFCRDAIWDADGSVCNWMGRSTTEITEARRSHQPDGDRARTGHLWRQPGRGLVPRATGKLRPATPSSGVRPSRRPPGRSARSIDSLRRRGIPVSYFSGLVGTVFAVDRVAALTGETAL